MTNCLESRLKHYAAVRPNGCIEWTGFRDKDGYGTISYKCKKTRVHRIMLEGKLGRPIAAGMKALHSCDNPACYNPDHLREGTQSENILEAFRKVRKFSPEQNSIKTHCPRGHAYDSLNTYVHRNKRYCRICVRAAKVRHRASRRVH